LIEF
jgi:hypothetical protein